MYKRKIYLSYGCKNFGKIHECHLGDTQRTMPDYAQCYPQTVVCPL